MGLQAAFFIILGGDFIVFGLALSIIVFVIGDLLLGNDNSSPEYQYPQILTFQLWLALPLLAFIIFCALWQVSTLDHFNVGQWIEINLGLTVLDNRGGSSLYQLVALCFLSGFYIGMIGTITAHELVHRTRDRISLFIGRWLLSFSFDCSFSIEHVYGHHRYVSTKIDPATAPRGRNVYTHIVLSTIRGNISAWNIEKKSLARKGHNFLSYRNRLLRGYVMSLILLIVSFQLAGLVGLLLFISAGIWGKCLLEIVNYMEHYGLARDPKQSVKPRHSWNTNKRISSWSMFNLTRHSHHHAKGSLPFHKLKPMPESPEMISGYLGTILITLIPPLWYRLMEPKLADWDQNYASEYERQLVKISSQNR